VTAAHVSVRVGSDGTLSLRNWATGAQCNPTTRLDLSGLDGQVLRLFERWMSLRDRSWQEEEIRVFGQLLHRRLFPGDCWDWVKRQAATREDDPVRLMLAFPADQASSRLASLPWEYLCAPDPVGGSGRFLVLEPWLVLSRVVPSGTLDYVERPDARVRILPVVGDATNSRLGIVDYDDVLQAIKESETRPGFSMLEPMLDATAAGLRATVTGPEGLRPHVVHFLGHGRFREGRGAVALCDPDGGTDWVDETRLARALCSDDWAPALVILHACEGGALQFEERFAGLAATLVQAGVLYVIAMQYAVTNSTARLFSTALYDALSQRRSLDEAVQGARRTVWEQTEDPRLLGVPMVYQRTAEPLLGGASKRGE
jgi:hypothetical protein